MEDSHVEDCVELLKGGISLGAENDTKVLSDPYRSKKSEIVFCITELCVTICIDQLLN